MENLPSGRSRAESAVSRRLCLYILNPSNLASVKVNYWKIAVIAVSEGLRLPSPHIFGPKPAEQNGRACLFLADRRRHVNGGKRRGRRSWRRRGGRDYRKNELRTPGERIWFHPWRAPPSRSEAEEVGRLQCQWFTRCLRFSHKLAFFFTKKEAVY